MGLLDDAIREHLDLKRRRGADPAEIERAEREALGPVRRNREVDPGSDAAVLAEAPENPAGLAQDEDDEGIATNLAEEFDSVEDPFEQPERIAGASGEDDVLADDDPFADAPQAAFVADEDEEPFAEEDPLDEEDLSPADSRALAEDDEAPEQDDGPRTELMRTVDLPDPDEEAATSEHPLEDAPAPPGDDGEDVLEETPEFLQDTPDHDRLWFEQRPPRDFDFDG